MFIALHPTCVEAKPWTGEDFRKWRKSLRITQTDAALSLGVPKQTIAIWEQSDEPIVRSVQLACRFLDERPWELILEN